MDYGLIGGIAQGINQGFDTYQMLKDKEERRKQQQIATALQRRGVQDTELQHGIQYDEGSGASSFTPEQIKKESRAGKLKEAQIGGGLLKEGVDMIYDENGEPTGRVKGNKQLAAAKEPKHEQYAAGGFAARLAQAENVFSTLAKGGYNRADRLESLKGYLPGELQGDNLRKQEQAERNFINATLRRESGSAISASEFDSAEKQYFPRPGDSPELLTQKAQNRALIKSTMQAEAGPAYGKIAGQFGSNMSSAPPVVPQEKEQYQVGKVYTGKNGKRAKYIGRGEFEEVPETAGSVK